MKSILLTSTALVAFAGAAMADAHEDSTPNGVTWNADGEFGYNEEVEGGFYFEGGMGVTTHAGMNSGLTAGFRMDVDLGFGTTGSSTLSDGTGRGTFDKITVGGSDFVLFVEGQGAGLYMGDTETAAVKQWSGPTNMGQDGFVEVDDLNDGPAKGDFVDGVLRGDMTYGPVSASASFLMTNDAGTELDGLDGLSLGGIGTFGNFTVITAYQQEVTETIVDSSSIDEKIAVSVGTTFSGANLKLGYATNQTTSEDSIGMQVGYTVGPVTGAVFYSVESAYDDNYGVALDYAGGPVSVHAHFHDGTDQEVALEGSYDAGMGIMAYAGYIQNDGDSDATEAYAAATYDLGGGAALLASYGDVGDTYAGANDEVGDKFEVNEGTTIAVTFKF
jgi:outer membrane protein OmpU